MLDTRRLSLDAGRIGPRARAQNRKEEGARITRMVASWGDWWREAAVARFLRNLDGLQELNRCEQRGDLLKATSFVRMRVFGETRLRGAVVSAD